MFLKGEFINLQVCIFITIIIINTLIALFYLLYGILKIKKRGLEKSHRQKYIIIFFVILICPVVSWHFLVLGNLIYKLLSHKDVDMSEVSFSRKRVEILSPADFNRDINIVPMKESLSISDVKRRRRMILDVLKKDARKSIGKIAMALDNPDSETSHYAASVITDALSEFRDTVQNMIKNFKIDPEAYEIGLLLFSNINEVLSQNILVGEEKISYTFMLDDVCDMIYAVDKNIPEGIHYRQVVERLMDIKEYAVAGKWAERALLYKPHQLDSYICNLKLHFQTSNRDMFFICLEQLKKTDIAVNKEIMECIRLFHE